MICQRIRRLSISKGCGVSTPPGGDLSSSEMEVKTSERVDRPERLGSLPYLRQQDPHQSKSRHRSKALPAVLSQMRKGTHR